MLEYEYSFKVKDIEPYIDYCVSNNYIKTLDNEQNRKLYINDSGIMARLTTELNGDNETVYLDFKTDNDSNELLKKSLESIPMVVDNSNEKSVLSILEILNYKLKKELIRKRVVYEKNNVKFEIDSYLKPEIFYVVGIEGEKNEVDKIYNEVTTNIISN